MTEEMLNHLVNEKMDYVEYTKLADEAEDENLKGMFRKIAEDEHNHYKMIREYIEKYLMKEM